MAQVSINEISFSEQVADDLPSFKGQSDCDRFSSKNSKQERVNRNFMVQQPQRTVEEKPKASDERLHPAFIKRLNKKASNLSQMSQSSVYNSYKG